MYKFVNLQHCEIPEMSKFYKFRGRVQGGKKSVFTLKTVDFVVFSGLSGSRNPGNPGNFPEIPGNSRNFRHFRFSGSKSMFLSVKWHVFSLKFTFFKMSKIWWMHTHFQYENIDFCRVMSLCAKSKNREISGIFL